ncbi:hypothetical protein ROLI_018110 [Roseobacter fucihabitans]|uniref:Uncharacterized protein n=1 Tax=Roseobacter fucihabitans TaxID=1537242 RepID=A0ABZ2BU57_9RHOB|nr:hypothetical protein [Roseobacter litoralis]
MRCSLMPQVGVATEPDPSSVITLPTHIKTTFWIGSASKTFYFSHKRLCLTLIKVNNFQGGQRYELAEPRAGNPPNSGQG